MPSRIAPAAAALTRKPGSGRDTQLNICIGIAVNGSSSDSGRKAIKESAPIVMIGAVSPIAREIANTPQTRLEKIVELDTDRAAQVLKAWLNGTEKSAA